MANYGIIWPDMVWYSQVCDNMAKFDMVLKVVVMVWSSIVWYGIARTSKVCLMKEWYGLVYSSIGH